MTSNSGIRDSNILITGGAGFIGSSVAKHLVKSNKVHIFDDFSRDNLSGTELENHKNIDIIRGSVLDAAAVQSATRDIEYVVHCAGIAGIDTVAINPVHTMRVNMIGSENILCAAQIAGTIKRIVCFSTSEVFGQIAFGAHETDKSVIGAAGEARWTYSVSKLAEEHLALAYYTHYGLPVSVLRPFNVYGPGQVGEGALKTFITRALNHEDIEIHGDGTQIRAWCFVDDMVDATLIAMDHPRAVGEAFNIGNPRCVETIHGLANTVVRTLDSRSRIVFVQKYYPDVELRVPAVRKAREILQFNAKVTLEDGIRRTAEFYRTYLREKKRTG